MWLKCATGMCRMVRKLTLLTLLTVDMLMSFFMSSPPLLCFSPLYFLVVFFFHSHPRPRHTSLSPHPPERLLLSAAVLTCQALGGGESSGTSKVLEERNVKFKASKQKANKRTPEKNFSDGWMEKKKKEEAEEQTDHLRVVAQVAARHHHPDNASTFANSRSGFHFLLRAL